MTSTYITMDTTDIIHALGGDSRVGPKFAGVFARDEFVAYVSRVGDLRGDYTCVFNTHTSDRPGEHWMLFESKNGCGYYFDSYGRHPDEYPDVASVLRSGFTRVYWNATRLQGLTTTACGDYCVVTALMSRRGWTLDETIRAFLTKPDAETRDHAVRSFTIQLYGEEGIGSIRDRRQGLTGIHSLHVERALELVAASGRLI